MVAAAAQTCICTRAGGWRREAAAESGPPGWCAPPSLKPSGGVIGDQKLDTEDVGGYPAFKRRKVIIQS